MTSVESSTRRNRLTERKGAPRMPTTVRFRDHEEFQRSALHMAIAGTLAGLGVYALGVTMPAFGGLTATWAAAALLGAAAFGAARPAIRLRVLELALVAGVSAAAGRWPSSPPRASAPRRLRWPSLRWWRAADGG